MKKIYAVCINATECNRELHNQKIYEIILKANENCSFHKVLVNGKIQNWDKSIFGIPFEK